MNDQLPLFADPLDVAFAEFDAANPRVWEHFCRLADLAIAAGRKRYSAKAIVEVMRWQLSIETVSEDGFKINGHHTKRYALKWLAEHPERAGFFNLRERAE